MDSLANERRASNAWESIRGSNERGVYFIRLGGSAYVKLADKVAFGYWCYLDRNVVAGYRVSTQTRAGNDLIKPFNLVGNHDKRPFH